MFGQRVPDSSTFRAAVGQAIIDQIRENASSGLNRKGKKFRGRAAKYSQQYAESLEFKAAGKSKNNVNMTLTGDMLTNMDVVKETRDTIVIGFADSEEAKKAHGHITGAKDGPRVKRDFFGLPVRQYKGLAEGFTLPRDEPTDNEITATGTLLTLRELFGG